MRKWRSASIAASAAVIMLTAACGAGTDGSEATGAQPAGQAAGAGYGNQGNGGYGGASPQGGKGGKGGKGGDSAAQSKPAGQLMIGDDKKLGSVLTDSGGFTLYRFDKDSADPATSNCDGDCATTWPPVPAADVSSAAGIDPSLLGEVTRADGTQQLTVAGWPMYRFSKDTKPWQTQGEGVDGTWHAAAPDGKPASADGGNPAAGGGSGSGTGPGEGGSTGTARLPALSTTENPELGTIIRDGKGRTLYRFSKDSAWPMKSNCTGSCLDTWKPAKPVDKAQVEGVDPKLLSTFTRPDGAEQLAIDCWLLYWYTGDEKPGDTNGQGVGDAWFVVAPDGRKIEKPTG